MRHITFLFFLALLSCNLTLRGAPLQPPFFPIQGGLQLGLDASFIDTSDTNQVVVKSGTMTVQNWYDQSGNGNGASQPTTWRQPVYVPNAVNGLPALQFDGMNVFMNTALAQIQGDKSIFIVEKRPTTAFGTELASTTGTAGQFLGDSWGGGSETQGRLGVAQDLQAPASIGHFILKSFILHSGTGTLQVGNVTNTATIADAAAGNYSLSNAAAYHFQGQIAEILIYNRALNSRELASIQSYLTDKWGLQDSLPPVTTGLQMRLAANTIDTSDPTQVTQQNGTYYVADWRDSSGNKLHATQSVAGRQPLYVPGSIYGQPAVVFTSGTEFLTTTLPQISGDKSIYVVERRVDSQLRTELSSSVGTSGMFLANVYGTSLESEGRLGVAQDMQTPGYMNGFILKSYIRSGTTATLSVNDTSTTGQAAPDVAAGTYAISDPLHHYPFNGPIAEVLIYNRALSPVEQLAVESYLSQKYGLWEVWLQVRQGLQVWLDAGVVETGTAYQFPQVSGSGSSLYVNTWLDRGPYGYNATQPVAANQPLFWAANAPGYNGANGNPVMRFDGSAPKFMGTPFHQLTANKSIFVVQRRRSSTLGREISSTTGVGHALENVGTNEARGPIGGTPTLQEAGGYYSYIVKDYVRSGATESLYVNGVPTTGTSAEVAGGNYSISDATSPFIGDIGTALIYSTALSGTQRMAVESYLANRWSYPPNDINSVTPDLQVPPDTGATPAPGVSIKMTPPQYAGSNVYNTLYLPTDWKPGQAYPVIVEFPDAAGYNEDGSTTQGTLEENALGYGISGGQGYIVIGMPFIGGSPLTNQTTGFGDVGSTIDYCLKTIQYVCQNYGGDSSAVIAAGFSRGAEACNYIGLNNPAIADTWLAFIPHSGYDYNGQYGPPWDDGNAAGRLALLNGRAQYISQGSRIAGDWEISPKYYLATTGLPMSQFTFRALPYANHNGTWALRPVQMRRDIRGWLQNILATRPGTYTVSGVVTDAHGAPLAGALVQTGATHFTYTAANGTYSLASLVSSTRTISVTAGANTFSPQTVTVNGANVANVNFQAGH